MFIGSLATILLLGAHGLVQATPLEDPLKGYTMVPMEWEVETSPGSGNYVTLNGTVEKIYHELLQINPNYDEEFDAYAAKQGEPEAEAEAKALDKRTDFSTSKYFCNGRWRGASTSEIDIGIKYLRRVNGRPSLGPGPAKCSRVSCSWNSAITWCNDTKSTKTLLSFGSIADGAQWLVAYCSQSDGVMAFTAGQVFHPTDWNVIVHNVGPCE